MDALDQLLQRAGNAGDMEAEALGLVAQELRTFRAALDDFAAILPRTGGALLPAPDLLGAIESLRAEVAALREELRAPIEKRRKAG